MRTLDPMKGHPSARKNESGTEKRCKTCDTYFPIAVFKRPGPMHRETPYCPACETAKRAEADLIRKRRREAFPY
jgi:hypothetical protein